MSSRWAGWVVAGSVLALAAGCRDELQLPSPGTGNAHPLAQAGTGSTYRVLSMVALDGSASFDPDGEIVAYRWTILSAPPTSTAAPTAPDASVTSFTPDLAGTYLAQLRVEDDHGAFDQNTVMFEVTPPHLVVDAGANTTIPWLGRAQLTGTMTVEPGFTATYDWTLVTRPPGSTASLTGTSTLTPSLIADVQGSYTVSLAAHTEFETVMDSVTIDASTPGLVVPGDFVAAEYSSALDRLILLQESYPLMLVIYDPATGTGTSVDLGFSGSFPAISLAPSGLRAAVSTPGSVAIVNLQTAMVEQTFDVWSFNWGIVFGPDNRVHCLPWDAVDEGLATLDVTTGLLTEVPTFGFEAGARLHPSGTAMYVVDSGGSSMIGRYDVASRPVVLQRQVTFTGQPALVPPLFFTEDGGSIITGLGTVLHASTNAALDMTYRGTLATHVDAAAHSAVTHEIAVLATARTPRGAPISTRLTMFGESTLAPRFSGLLPERMGAPLTALALAYRADGALYVLGSSFTETIVYVMPPP